MKKILLILFIISNISFAQNGIEAIEGDAKILTKSANLSTVLFLKTGKVEEIFVPQEVFDKCHITKLEFKKDYFIQMQVINGKNIVYYISKSNKQITLDRRKSNDSLSMVLRPKLW